MYIPYLAHIDTPYLFLYYYDILFNLIHIQPNNIPPSSPSSSLLGSSRKTRINCNSRYSSPTSPSPTYPFPLILRPRGPLGEKKRGQVSLNRALLLPLPSYSKVYIFFPFPLYPRERESPNLFFYYFTSLLPFPLPFPLPLPPTRNLS